MQTPSTYIDRTETAVRKLFEGIASYTELLKPIQGTTYVSGQLDPILFQAEYEAWAKKNAKKLAASAAAQREYSQQSFAMATLCGAVLQVAAKAIECYSTNTVVSAKAKAIIDVSKPAIPFCIGREIRGMPIGLIIYAGRNQHTHYNEEKLDPVNQAIFDHLAVVPRHSNLKDPAMDLANQLLDSHAGNVTFILGWRSYEAYASDLHSLLET